MIIARIEGTTRLLGKSQGYLGLPIKDEILTDEVSGQKVHTMTSAWEPTTAELERLQAGAKLHVCLFGVEHPPIMVSVGDVPSIDP